MILKSEIHLSLTGKNMSEKNRKTLKNYFKIGRKPSEQAFEDLIDSSLNMIDEGIRKTPADGLKISQLEQGKLISFDQKDAISMGWSIRLDENNVLVIGGDNTSPVLKISADGRIHINDDAIVMYPPGSDQPQGVDVSGFVRSKARMGNFKSPDDIEEPIPADGKWHDLIKNISGGSCFEIMAGARNKQNEKYALLHAFALNAGNPESIFNKFFKKSNIFIDFFKSKKKIISHHAYYNLKCDKLKLRWVTPDPEERKNYSLQIKTNCCYGDETAFINYHITQLWEDSFFNPFGTNSSGQ